MTMKVYKKFIYNLPEALQQLMIKEIVNFNDTALDCWINVADARELRHRSLYLVCDYRVIGSNAIYSMPMGIVAKNNMEALEAYHDVTTNTNGTIHSELENNCAKMKIIPTDITLRLD